MVRGHKKLISILLVTGLITFGLAEVVLAKPAITLRLGHEHTAVGPPHEACIKFAEVVGELTNGEVKVNVFPGGALGKERQMYEAIQAGSLDFMFGGACLLATFAPGSGMDFFSLPGTQKDLEYFVRSTRTNGLFCQKVSEIIEPKGFKFLALGGPMFKNFLTRKTLIYTLKDIKNLKMRVPEVPVMIEGMRALGAQPVALPFGEVYTALQLGTVDGVGISPPNTITMKFYEVAKCFSIYPQFPIIHDLVASQKVWNGLDPKHQKAVEKAAEEWRRVFNEGYVGMAERGLRWLAIEGGVTICAVKERKRFDELMTQVNMKYRKKEPGIEELYQLMKKSAAMP